MGRMSTEALDITNEEELIDYLRRNHAAYMQYNTKTYYLTDANDIYWRAQDTDQLNEKEHFVDCSDLVPTLTEFVALPFHEGKAIRDMFEKATFYASRKVEGQGTPVLVM